MAWKIRWSDGGTTASVYSSKLLAEKILKKSKRKGSVVKASLNYCPRTPLSNKKCVWVRHKASVHGFGKGHVYDPRAVDALSKAEKKRVVRK